MSIQSILSKLNEHGLSDAEIGERVKASQSIINRLRNGQHKQTSYDRGRRIVDLARSLGVADDG